MREDVVIEGEVEARVGNVHPEEHSQQLIQNQRGEHGPEQPPGVKLGPGEVAHRRVKITQVGLVGMGEHHAVAAAVPVGRQVALLHIGDGLGDASPFLGTVAVGCREFPGKQAVVIHFQLCAEHGHVLVAEPRLHPVAQAGGHHQHLVPSLEGAVHS